jgi:hypothetical protein
MDEPEKLAPLQGLIGEWEGDDGLDVSYHHAEGAPGETRYREKVMMNPFGPVDSGTRCLHESDTVLRMTQFEDLCHHTDANTLHRVA